MTTPAAALARQHVAFDAPPRLAGTSDRVLLSKDVEELRDSGSDASPHELELDGRVAGLKTPLQLAKDVIAHSGSSGTSKLFRLFRTS